MAEAIYNAPVMDADVADVLMRGMRDPATLTEVETGRFTSHWMYAFFGLQNWFYQWRDGALDEGICSGWHKILTDIHQTPGIRSVWQQGRRNFSDEFRAYSEPR